MERGAVFAARPCSKLGAWSFHLLMTGTESLRCSLAEQERCSGRILLCSLIMRQQEGQDALPWRLRRVDPALPCPWCTALSPPCSRSLFNPQGDPILIRTHSPFIHSPSPWQLLICHLCLYKFSTLETSQHGTIQHVASA